MRRSLRVRVLATYLLLAGVILAVASGATVSALWSQYLASYGYVLVTQARLLSLMFTEYAAQGTSHAQMTSDAQQFRWRPETVIRVLDERGRAPGEPAGPLPPEVQSALAGRPEQHVRFDQASGTLRVFAAAPITAGGRIAGVVQVSMPTTWVSRQIQSFLPWLGLAALLGLAAAGAVGFRLARSITSPVSELTAVAHRIAAGDLRSRARSRTDDELGQLAASFNHMAEQLERMIAEAAAQRAQIEAILASMSDAVIAVDRGARIVHTNRAAEDLLGLGEPSWGTPLLEASDCPGLPEGLRRGLAGEAFSDEFTLLAGGERAIEAHWSPVRDERGEVAGAVAVLRDVTDLRRAERLRRELVANVSHELRTPLTSIKGFAETLLGGAADDEAARRRFLEIIDHEADRLIALTDDLLELARFEHVGVALQVEPVEVTEVVRDTMASMRPIGRGLELRTEVPADPVVVPADRARLEQVLTNLISNAIKFTADGGSITAGVRTGRGAVEVWVADTGRGIPPEDLPHIFERFYRVDRSRARDSGGTGLGLAIAKHIIEAHGGTIRAWSRAGHGTTFTFTLPRDGYASEPRDRRGAARPAAT